MCGIAGWIDWKNDLRSSAQIMEKMVDTMIPRGPDARGIWMEEHIIFGHSRLAVIDIEGGKQPMVRKRNNELYTITYNGELYNTEEIRLELKGLGYVFHGHSDTEVLLLSYIAWGPECVKKLNGIFAFGIWDSVRQSLFLARDRIGVKPLFYTVQEGSLIFASELKALLAHPEIPSQIDIEGLAEIFLIGPARTPGFGVFKNILELKPGCSMLYRKDKLNHMQYWKLRGLPHKDDFETTVGKVRNLVMDAIKRQLVSDVPIGTLLSGGLDSSIITAVAANSFHENNKGPLPTFSIDYVGNKEHFKANAFQPDPDAPWVEKMEKAFHTKHKYFYLENEDLVNSLENAVIARDLPGMADVDSSLLLFSKKIKENVTVGLSGECADEVFGGYPWFHRQESLNSETFPWAMYPETRLAIMSPELIAKIQPQEFLNARYSAALAEVPEGPDASAANDFSLRKVSYLTLTRFMPTLLDRKDRMTMSTGLEVRVPFCDHHIVDYVWNIPWHIKNYKGREKGLLRTAMQGILPDDVLWRKKSPYPKTHNPAFLQAVSSRLLDILNNPSSPLLPLINKKNVLELIANPVSTANKPWFGQLMDTPRVFSYLIQMDFWLRHYKVDVSL